MSHLNNGSFQQTPLYPHSELSYSELVRGLALSLFEDSVDYNGPHEFDFPSIARISRLVALDLDPSMVRLSERQIPVLLSRSNAVGRRVAGLSEALIEAKAPNPLVIWDFFRNNVELLKPD
jgi:predicted HTH domain antitoxin